MVSHPFVLSELNKVIAPNILYLHDVEVESSMMNLAFKFISGLLYNDNHKITGDLPP